MWTLYGVVLLVCGITAQNQNSFCDGLRDLTGIVPASVPGCRHFYQCNEGVAFLKTCAPGSFFNPSTLICDSETCVEDRNMLQLDCVPGVQPQTDCRDFVLCDNNIPVPFRCNNGTMYSNFYSVCVHNNQTIADIQQCNINSN